jgi:hypothetical protein
LRTLTFTYARTRTRTRTHARAHCVAAAEVGMVVGDSGVQLEDAGAHTIAAFW